MLPLPSGFAEMGLRDVLRRTVGRNSAAVALVGAGERLSYADLMGQIEAIAASLMATTPPDSAVAVALPERPSTVTAMLGCLVARRVCVVLDPGQPMARCQAILDDAGVHAVISDPGFGIAHSNRMTLAVLLDGGAPAEFPEPFHPDAPALVTYTSGSTGQPKGIVTSTHAILRRAMMSIEPWGMDAADCIIGLTPVSANSGLSHRLSGLCVGGSVVTHAVATDGIDLLVERLCEERATIFITGPAVLRSLLQHPLAAQAFARLRVLRSAGAALVDADLAALRRVLPASCLIDHTYASTEAGIVAHWFVPRDYAGGEARIPSGVPIDGVDLVFHPDTSELSVRSRCVALGEWRDGRTVPGRATVDPVDPTLRWFATGDIMRFGADGMLRFVSRGDEQVKINGVRIEPAEIEAVLRAEPGVADAVVVVRTDRIEPRLFGYVAAPLADTAMLRRRLLERVRQALPPAMRPSDVVVLDDLPRLSGGKVDQHALPEPGQAPFHAPCNDREALLCRLFAEFTQTARVGIDDSFFALGGDSLAAMRLVAELHTATGQDWPLHLIYLHPTPAELAPQLDAVTAYSPLLALRPDGATPPLFCVHPIGGYALAFRYLVERIDPRVPVWGLQARGLLHGEAPHESIIAMAAAYVAAIREVQPEGPYRLLGWSIGGMIAHAMACQLEASGQVVERLVILDTRLPPLSLDPEASPSRLPSLSGIAQADARAAGMFRERAIASGLVPESAPESWGTGMLEQLRLGPGRIWRHRPGVSAAPILLVRATLEPRDADGGAQFDWRRLTTGCVTQVDIASRHEELGDPAHAAALAAALNPLLVSPVSGA